jgi:hypothetical protein
VSFYPPRTSLGNKSNDLELETHGETEKGGMGQNGGMALGLGHLPFSVPPFTVPPSLHQVFNGLGGTEKGERLVKPSA